MPVRFTLSSYSCYFIVLFYIVYIVSVKMPPKDPELIALRKELEDLIAKCQVKVMIINLFVCLLFIVCNKYFVKKNLFSILFI